MSTGTGITKEEVGEARDHLVATGRKPTQRAILARLGRGSFSSVGPLLRELDAEAGEAAGAALTEPLAAAVAEAAGAATDRLWHTLGAEADRVVADARSVFETDLAAAHAERDAALATAERLRDRLAAEEGGAAELRERLAGASAALERLRETNAAETALLAQARARGERFEALAEERRAELERRAAEHERLRTAERAERTAEREALERREASASDAHARALSGRDERGRALDEALAGSRAMLARQETLTGAAHEERDRARTRMEVLGTERDAALARAERGEAALEAARREVREARAEHETMRRTAADLSADVAALQTRLGAAHALSDDPGSTPVSHDDKERPAGDVGSGPSGV